MESGGSSGSGGAHQQALPPPPCGACGHLRTGCGPKCVFVPFFPPGSEADFASVRTLYSLESILCTVTTLEPELAKAAVKFMIRESKARANNRVPTRLHHLISSGMLLTDLLRLMPELQRLAAVVEPTEPPVAANPREDGGVGGGGDFGNPLDLVIRRGEPTEVAVRSVRAEASSSVANVALSAPTISDGDDNEED